MEFFFVISFRFENTYGSEQVTLEAKSLLIIPFHELILFNIFETEKFFVSLLNIAAFKAPCSLNFIVNSHSTSRIQEIHLLAIHCICKIIDLEFS